MRTNKFLIGRRRTKYLRNKLLAGKSLTIKEIGKKYNISNNQVRGYITSIRRGSKKYPPINVQNTHIGNKSGVYKIFSEINSTPDENVRVHKNTVSNVVSRLKNTYVPITKNMNRLLPLSELIRITNESNAVILSSMSLEYKNKTRS